MAQKGGIFLTLLILSLIAGGIFGIYYLSLDSLPGQFLYPVKQELEKIRLSTTELSKVKRALVYIDFANERLDEAEALGKKGEEPGKIIPALNKFLENEQLIIKVMRQDTARVEDPTEVYEELKNLRKRQEFVLDYLLGITPDPEFYTILDIKDKAMDTLNDYNLR